MALWICSGPEGCGTAYAVDAPACPHCGGTEHVDDHDLEFVGEHGPELVKLPAGAEVKPAK